MTDRKPKIPKNSARPRWEEHRDHCDRCGRATKREAMCAAGRLLWSKAVGLEAA
jgi:hypothetical protein